jgi:hypothetical protein
MQNPNLPIEKKDVIRQELNIEKWPLFTTSTYREKSREIIREAILENGDRITRKVTIGKIRKEEIGVLRLQDYKTLCVLVHLWEKVDRPINSSVSFALHQLAHILKLQWGGKTHKELYQSLERLKAIPIIWEDSFYQKKTDTTEKMVTYFNLLDDLTIFERRKGARKEETYLALSGFKLNGRLINNLLSNYSKPIYLDVIMKLKKDISLLLYRFIDLIMADKNCYERKTKELFRDLELSEYKYSSQRNRLLSPALKELEGLELTTGVLSYARLEQTIDGKDWKVVFRKSKKSLQIEHKEEETKEASKEVGSLLEFFNQKFPNHQGALKEALAEKLIKKYSFDKVMLHISRMSSDGSIQSPVGLLLVSLEQDWDLPPTKEEIQQYQRQEKKEQERKQQEEQQRERESYFQEKEEEERLDKIFVSLSEKEQETLKEEAKRLIIEERLDNPQGKVNELFLRDIMVMIKVREVLKEREKVDTGVQG